jgi:transketolase
VKHKPVPVEMVGIEDRFMECGLPEELAVKYNLTAPALVVAVKKVIGRK